jgi:hypothetical protein
MGLQTDVPVVLEPFIRESPNLAEHGNDRLHREDAFSMVMVSPIVE